MKTLIVVANRTNARLLRCDGPGRALEIVGELEHPEGRKANRDMDTDRPGRAYDRHGPGRHAMEKEQSTRERSAADFARAIARAIETARNDAVFEDVVLVADPRFLGMLRDSLDPVTSRMVRGTVRRDLAHLEPRDLPPHLSEILPIG